MPQSGLSITIPTEGLIKATKAAEAALANKQQELLELMGDYLLDKVREDYQTKSKGGTGEDGVTWDGLLASSLRSRKGSQRRSSGAKERQDARRKKARGTSSKEASRKRISPSAGNYQIGVDTGAQFNTLKSKKGGDAGPSVVIGEESVTVQAAMSYSKYFAKLRPIVPDKVPEKWVKELEGKVEMLGEEALDSEFKKLD